MENNETYYSNDRAELDRALKTVNDAMEMVVDLRREKTEFEERVKLLETQLRIAREAGQNRGRRLKTTGG